MQFRSEKILCLVLLATMVAVAIWGYFHLPDGPVAVHFGLDGAPNGFQPRNMALWLMPAITFATIVLCLWVLPAIMPKHASIERSQTAYGATMLSAAALLTVAHTAIILTAAGLPMDMPKIALSGVGLLFIIIGNYLPKTRSNWLMGVRNVWTLSDERVWDKTHRFAGPLFMLAGLVIIVMAFIAPIEWQLGMLLAAVFAPAALSYAYSWAAARRLR
jgi:uncharacterized membrane protein